MAAQKPRSAWQETSAKKPFERKLWVGGALCATHPDKSIFFPVVGKSARVAKEVCASCPVWKECLQYALDNHERYDIWGGLGFKERNRVHHSDGVRKCQKCGSITVFSQRTQSLCGICDGSKSRNRKRSG